LAFAVFATLTPHCQPSPKNELRHFSALPTHHPTSGQNKKICSGIIDKKVVSLPKIVRTLNFQDE